MGGGTTLALLHDEGEEGFLHRPHIQGHGLDDVGAVEDAWATIDGDGP